jgi:hypothetical protein
VRFRLAPQRGYARGLGQVLGAVALIAAVCAPFLPPESRNAVWINSAALLSYVGMERFAASYWPGRPVSLLRCTLFLVCVPILFLIAAFFLEGDVTYANDSGYFSHANGAWLVALAGVVLHLSSVIGAAAVGKVRGFRPSESRIVLSGFRGGFHLLVAVLAGAALIARVMLLFYQAEMSATLAYFLRVFLGNGTALFIFLGIALRLRHPSALVVSAATLGMSVVVLLSGSRADALLPPAFLVIGYVMGGPVERRTLVAGAIGAGTLFLFSMSLGSVLRDDERGRTGQAVGARFEELGSRIGEGSRMAIVTEASVRRMVSDSAHSVITRVPVEVPFEPGGLLNIPEELWTKFVPRLNYSGISETETPRNWMLNEFGFLVKWSTSVELTLVADAWYRGGFLGLIVVGLLLGMVLQAQENLVYRAMLRRPQYSAVLFFSASGLLLVEGRDVVSALRGMVFLIISGLILAVAATLVQRRSPPLVAEPRSPAVGTASGAGDLVQRFGR